MYSCWFLVQDFIIDNKNAVRLIIFSPVVTDKKGEFSNLFINLRSKGIRYIRVDGKILDINEEIFIIKTNKHSIEAQIDRLSFNKSQFKDKVSKTNLKGRITESVEKGIELSNGLIIMTAVLDKSYDIPEFPVEMEDHLFSEKYACL